MTDEEKTVLLKQYVDVKGDKEYMRMLLKCMRSDPEVGRFPGEKRSRDELIDGVKLVFAARAYASDKLEELIKSFNIDEKLVLEAEDNARMIGYIRLGINYPEYFSRSKSNTLACLLERNKRLESSQTLPEGWSLGDIEKEAKEFSEQSE